MLKTYLYLPEELDKRIKQTAKEQKKSKAEVIREAVDKGLDKVGEPRNGGADALLKIAEIGKKYNLKGPKDGSINHDYYLWGLPKKK